MSEFNVKGKHVFDSAHVTDSAWVYGSAQVSGLAWVGGLAFVGGSARVSDSARVGGSAHVDGLARVGGSAFVGGSAWVGGHGLIDDAHPAKWGNDSHYDWTCYYDRKLGWVLRYGCELHPIATWPHAELAKTNNDPDGEFRTCALVDYLRAVMGDKLNEEPCE